ncbi:glycosyltransferase family 9 protein, partial [bacterium]|nr:glycosyltransferase family 9 protein [bacterium]
MVPLRGRRTVPRGGHAPCLPPLRPAPLPGVRLPAGPASGRGGARGPGALRRGRRAVNVAAGADFRRILLIRRKALGDALVSLPAVAAIAEAWPGAAIDLVVDRPLAGLLAELAPAVRVVSYPDGADGPWLRWLRRRRYDLVVDWLGSPRTALWTALSGARLRVGYDLPGRRWAYNLRVPRNRAGEHRLRGFAGEAFLDPVRALGLDPAPWRIGAAGDRSRPLVGGGPFARWLGDWVRAGEGPRVALVMSATWPAKAWPPAHVAGLWELLTAAGARVVLAPGPGDDALLAALADRLPPSAVAPPS